MSFLDTEPAPLQSPGAAEHWARFSVSGPRRRVATLRELCRCAVPLTVGPSGGPALACVLWAVNEAHDLLHFKIVSELPLMQFERVTGNPHLWAAGYLHEAKVQFDLPEFIADGDSPHPMLHASLPGQMVQMPRRRALRVRRDPRHSPALRFTHPLSGQQMRLGVADISMTGCALWRSAGGPPLMPGMLVCGAEVTLDAAARFEADLEIQHVTVVDGPTLRLRVGCNWKGMTAASAEKLQQWIAHGRRRRDLVTLGF